MISLGMITPPNVSTHVAGREQNPSPIAVPAIRLFVRLPASGTKATLHDPHVRTDLTCLYSVPGERIDHGALLYYHLDGGYHLEASMG